MGRHGRGLAVLVMFALVVFGMAVAFTSFSEKIAESEQQHEAIGSLVRILFTVPDASVVSTNDDDQIMSSSVPARKLLGYSSRELLGKHLADLMEPKAAKQHRSAMKEARLRGNMRQGIMFFKCDMITKSGGVTPSNITIRQIHSRDGTIFFVLIQPMLTTSVSGLPEKNSR